MSRERQDAIRDELRRDREELRRALDETIEDTIRQAWKVNAVAWVAVTAGAFAINLLVLVLVAGR
jgi:hypothetical protein